MTHRLSVALLSPPYATLTYALPAYFSKEVWVIGLRIAVPLGNGFRVGLILDTEQMPCATDEAGILTLNADSGADFIIKDAVWPLEQNPLLSRSYLDLAEQLALRQFLPLGRVLGTLLPAGLRTTQTKIRFFTVPKPIDLRIRDLCGMAPDKVSLYAQLWREGRALVIHAKQDAALAELCELTVDPPWPVRPAAKKQLALLDYLYDRGKVSRRNILDSLGKGVLPALNKLISQDMIRLTPESCGEVANAASAEDGGIECLPLDLVKQEDMLPPYFTLTSAQQQVFDDLNTVLQDKKANSRLLFGITGSGKTAVYLELARQCLLQGRSVFLLAPEVALVFKLWKEVQDALPQVNSYLYHGYQSGAVKESIFRQISLQKEPCIVIGSRSALFLPLFNIGLIVLDEEHDTSFKQDEGLVYQAKDIAWYRARQDNSLLLLGSATPDIKTYHAVLEDHIAAHTLNERVGGGELPSVELVQWSVQDDDNVLMPESVTALQDTVSRGEQAVILLNRRGYAPLMYCLSCKKVIKCPHCDISLAYHKNRERLLCHYCGYSIPFPSPCNYCGGAQYRPMGDGTEKIEERLTALLPAGERVLRLDKDTTRRQGQMENILAAFARKEAAVLIGTQMLSKGHHFPDVTLAIIADADLGINLPDYRAAERTFQLLLQASGRAGRGHKRGKVLIQTRDLTHYCWEFVKEADYTGFYNREIALREQRRYPPFVKLGLVRLSYAGRTGKGAAMIQAVGAALKEKGKEQGVSVLGPAPSPLAFLQGRSRFQCLLKAADWSRLRAVYAAAYSLADPKVVRMQLDLDPVSML